MPRSGLGIRASTFSGLPWPLFPAPPKTAAQPVAGNDAPERAAQPPFAIHGDPGPIYRDVRVPLLCHRPEKTPLERPKNPRRVKHVSTLATTPHPPY